MTELERLKAENSELESQLLIYAEALKDIKHLADKWGYGTIEGLVDKALSTTLSEQLLRRREAENQKLILAKKYMDESSNGATANVLLMKKYREQFEALDSGERKEWKY